MTAAEHSAFLLQIVKVSTFGAIMREWRLRSKEVRQRWVKRVRERNTSKMVFYGSCQLDDTGASEDKTIVGLVYLMMVRVGHRLFADSRVGGALLRSAMIRH